MDAAALAQDSEILRVVNGSKLYGTDTPDSDRDEIGVCIVPPKVLLGFQNFEQYTYTSSDDTQRNTADDYDLTIYSAKKFAKLVMEGNPSLLNLLWVPEDKRLCWTPWADSLMQIEAYVHSRVAIGKFLGYMTAQIKRMKGESKKHTPNRPELVERYGYDTKFAAHAIRLGYQGLEFSVTGKISVPMPEPIREAVLAIRYGQIPLAEVMQMADDYVALLERQKERTDIPKQPNREMIEKIVVDLHLSYWHTKGLI